MDLLGELVEHLGLRCKAPVVHTFEGRWAVEIAPGPPTVHLIRRGRCHLWTPSARHPWDLVEASLIFRSGSAACTLQARAPRLEPTGQLDWRQGRALRRSTVLPNAPDALQLLSARIEIARHTGPIHRLPDLALVGPARIPLPRSYRPLLDSLLEELSFARIGGEVIVRTLLDVLVIQTLRIDVTHGFGSREGWLGALSDPVLRTCLDEQHDLGARDPARSLAASSARSPRRLGARLKAATGTGPRPLSQQRRIQRVLQLLEEGVHPLGRIAQAAGFSTVSGLCRAFRREVGTSPGAYWRRVQQRRLPRKPGSEGDRG